MLNANTRSPKLAVSGVLGSLALFVVATVSIADNSTTGDYGRIVYTKGDVTHYQPTQIMNPPAKGAHIFEGDTFETGADGFVSVKFSSGTMVNIQPDSKVSIEHIACVDESVSCVISIHAEHGELSADVTPREDGKPPINFKVTTPFLSGAVRGTSFYVSANQDSNRLGVTSGVVATTAAGETQDLPIGRGLLAAADNKPAAVELLKAPELQIPTAIFSQQDHIRWNALPQATHYRLAIAMDEKLTNPVFTQQTQNNNVPIGKTLPPGEYYVSVAGVDGKKFIGLPSIAPLIVAEIVDQEKIELTMNYLNGALTIEPLDYDGEIELSISNNFDNPTEHQRITRSLSEALLLQLDRSQDWVIRARKVLSPTTVSVYSDFYLLEATK